MREFEQQCILSAPNQAELEARVRDFLRLGWQRRGKVAVAQAVLGGEPYLSQSMYLAPSGKKRKLEARYEAEAIEEPAARG